MAGHIAKIITQARLAKAHTLNKIEDAIRDLSTILPGEAMRCPHDYLAAVANIIDIDMRGELDLHDDIDTQTKQKRAYVTECLREAKTRPESCGEFLRHMSRLAINVQLVWIEMAKERPLHRLFTLARSYPELILPESFKMRAYFARNEVPMDIVTILRHASNLPEMEHRMPRRRTTSHQHRLHS